MKKTEFKNKKLAGVLILLSVIAFMAVVAWFVGRPMIELMQEPDKFRAWVDSNGILGKAGFSLMMAFQVVIAVIPGEPLEIGAGYAFGAVWGTILCLLGTVIGSTVVFLVVKKWGIKVLNLFFSSEKIKNLKFLQNERRLNLLAFILFFIPGTPKDILTYVFALTDIKLGHWLLLTTVARIPSVITSTIGGSALGEQNYSFAIIVFVITLAVSAAGALVYRKIIKYRENRGAQKRDETITELS